MVRKYKSNTVLTFCRLMAESSAASQRITKLACLNLDYHQAELDRNEADGLIALMLDQFGDGALTIEWTYRNCIGQGMSWEDTTLHLLKHFTND